MAQSQRHPVLGDCRKCFQRIFGRALGGALGDIREEAQMCSAKNKCVDCGTFTMFARDALRLMMIWLASLRMQSYRKKRSKTATFGLNNAYAECGFDA